MHYAISTDELLVRYREQVRLYTRMPDALSGAMGNQVAIACFDTEEEVRDFVRTAFAQG